MTTSKRNVNSDVRLTNCGLTLSTWSPLFYPMTRGRRYDLDLCEHLNFKQLFPKIPDGALLKRSSVGCGIVRRKRGNAQGVGSAPLIVVRTETRREETDLTAVTVYARPATAAAPNQMRTKQTAARQSPRGKRITVSRAWLRLYYLTAEPRNPIETERYGIVIAIVRGNVTETGIGIIVLDVRKHRAITLESGGIARRNENGYIIAVQSVAPSMSFRTGTSGLLPLAAAVKMTKSTIVVVHEIQR